MGKTNPDRPCSYRYGSLPVTLTRVLVIFIFLILTGLSYGRASRKIVVYPRGFQVSFFPGISTNGFRSGSYYNMFSLNLFSGLSAGNSIVEIGTFSNVNLKGSSGLQIAGLTNCSTTRTQMPLYGNNKKYNQNALILGYDHRRKTWETGYGFRKVLMNKESVEKNPKNERLMMSCGIAVLHLNRSYHFDKTMNLLTRFDFRYGIKLFGLRIFGGISLNYFLDGYGNSEDIYRVGSHRIGTGKLFGLRSTPWPGYSAGNQL